MSPRVTVSIPCYLCRETLRTAVESVLRQTFDSLRVVVVNDGDTSEIWSVLADIDDPRLFRFDLRDNMGRYYADAVVLGATDTPLFAVHDADDYADPQWVRELADAISESGSVAAFSPHVLHRRGRTPTIEPIHAALTSRSRLGTLTQLAHHAGLYRTDALRAAGGYHPTYRIGYDTMIVNLVRMIGPCAVSPTPRYHRVSRLGSLTTSRQTGFGSQTRTAVKRQLESLYRVAANTPPTGISDLVERTIPTAIRDSVAMDSSRLAKLIGAR